MEKEDYYSYQRTLDLEIIKKHPHLEGEDLLHQKTLAFLVELGEFLNELPKEFKFWSKKENNYEKALQEYVDLFHFLLTIGIDIETKVYDFKDVYENSPFKTYREKGDITIADLVGMLFTVTTSFKDKPTKNNYDVMALYLMGIGKKAGFSWGDIEREYKRKNGINKERQNQGY